MSGGIENSLFRVQKPIRAFESSRRGAGRISAHKLVS